MRRSPIQKTEVKDADPDAKLPVRKVHLQRRVRPKRRSNSIGAFGCSRQACVTATTNLCRQGRISIQEHDSPVLDLLVQNCSPKVQGKLRQIRHGDHNLSFLDLPTKSVQVIGATRWEFDIFSFKRRCSSNLICSLGLHLFEIHRLFGKLQLDHLATIRALTAIESVYWQHNPYHTALHAADVAQALHCFITLPKLRRLLSPAEILGSILAAFCHDADHPGTNQLHLERTGHFLVGLYNGNSVLEQHHARIGLAILHQSGLAKCLSRKDWNTVRNCLVKMIHATDMAQQGYYKAKFAKLVNSKRIHPSSSCTTAADRILLLQMSLKCADVSNPCRPWDTCRRWAYRVCEEFFCQGDQERFQWSLVPSKGFDRTTALVPAIQVAFIDSCIRPLFVLWNDFFQSNLTERLLSLLNENYVNWQRQIPEQQLQNESSSTVQPNSLAEEKRTRKPLVFNWSSTRQKIVNPLSEKGKNGMITFDLTSSKQSVRTEDNEGRESLQTFLITTCALRRHSLPETQGAIRKAFNFAQSKRSSTSSCSVTSNVIKPDHGSPTVYCVYLTAASFRKLRTASGNILQTLCEEIISHQPRPRKSSCALESLDPFPLPEAWNIQQTGTSVGSNEPQPAYLTKVAIHFSLRQLISAHRRSSVPVTEQ